MRMKKILSTVLAMGIVVTSVCCSGSLARAEAFQESGKIWVVGDSISSDHNDEDNLKENKVPITGWGNVLKNFLSKDVTIENKARSGRSSQSYTREQVYKEVMRGIQEGDYLIVQFGHNDEKADNNGLYTDPAGDSSTEKSYKWYLKEYFVDPALEKGARVILASSVVRYTFEDGKRGEQSHEAYAKAMKELAEEYDSEDVLFIDTYQLTDKLYDKLGEDGAKKLHAVLKQDPDTELDTTHYGPYGAVCAADLIAKELKGLGIKCCQDIKHAKLMDSDAAAAARKSAEKFGWR